MQTPINIEILRIQIPPVSSSGRHFAISKLESHYILLLALFQVFENLCQRRDDFKKVVNNTVVGHLEDWCLRILIDRNDAPRRLHAHQMLNRSRDSQGDIELRGDSLA